MSKVFQLIPKCTKRANGAVLTPEMVVTVTTQIHTTKPINKSAKDVKEENISKYYFNCKKACS